MRIIIQATGLDLTPSLKVYIEQKLGGLSKFLQRFEERGELEMRVEVARTTKHHHRGRVFMAEVNLELPKRLLRGTRAAGDIRTAIDEVRNILRLEIEKYKTKFDSRPRVSPKKLVRGK